MSSILAGRDQDMGIFGHHAVNALFRVTYPGCHQLEIQSAIPGSALYRVAMFTRESGIALKTWHATRGISGLIHLLSAQGNFEGYSTPSHLGAQAEAMLEAYS